MLLTAGLLFFTACSTAPEKYFNIAVLNCNMMHGFATNGLQRELESPSAEMVNGDPNKTAPVKRSSIIEDKIRFAEENLQKIKALKSTDETRDMLNASIALHEYILPVYKNEYSQLAKLYDDGAATEQINVLSESIRQKYYPGFIKLFDDLTRSGKAYADKNQIKVNWNIQTSPM